MSFDVSNPLKPTIVHDPQARLDYTWDLTNVIGVDDALQSTTFVSGNAGVLAEPGTNVGKNAVAWISVTDLSLIGQTIGVTCHFTTVAGRVDDRTLFFKIKDR